MSEKLCELKKKGGGGGGGTSVIDADFAGSYIFYLGNNYFTLNLGYLPSKAYFFLGGSSYCIAYENGSFKYYTWTNTITTVTTSTGYSYIMTGATQMTEISSIPGITCSKNTTQKTITMYNNSSYNYSVQFIGWR